MREEQERNSHAPLTPAVASPGIVIVDAAMDLVGMNTEAERVFSYPGRLGNGRTGWREIRERARLHFSARHAAGSSVNGETFLSGRRRYRWRVFPFEATQRQPGVPAAVIVIERDQPAWFAAAKSLARFGLTRREEQVAHLVLAGLTNKQIGQRLGISPNTVKALLHLSMTKMDVSSRSGIIGRVLGLESLEACASS